MLLHIVRSWPPFSLPRFLLPPVDTGKSSEIVAVELLPQWTTHFQGFYCSRPYPPEQRTVGFVSLSATAMVVLWRSVLSAVSARSRRLGEGETSITEGDWLVIDHMAVRRLTMFIVIETTVGRGIAFSRAVVFHEVPKTCRSCLTANDGWWRRN